MKKFNDELALEVVPWSNFREPPKTVQIISDEAATQWKPETSPASLVEPTLTLSEVDVLLAGLLQTESPSKRLDLLKRLPGLSLSIGMLQAKKAAKSKQGNRGGERTEKTTTTKSAKKNVYDDRFPYFTAMCFKFKRQPICNFCSGEIAAFSPVFRYKVDGKDINYHGSRDCIPDVELIDGRHPFLSLQVDSFKKPVDAQAYQRYVLGVEVAGQLVYDVLPKGK